MLDEVLKYKAPSVKALPSLSTVGAEDLEPKYLSSKVSTYPSAAVALAAAAFLLTTAAYYSYPIGFALY